MQAILNNHFDGLNDPITILANIPLCHEGDTTELESSLSEFIFEMGFLGECDVHFVAEAGGTWPNDVLNKVSEGDGLVLLHLSKDEDEDDFSPSISKFYTVSELKSLRISKNVGDALYALCMMAEDVTEPVRLHDPASANEGLVDSTLLTPDDEMVSELEMLNNEHCLFSTDSLAVYLFKGQVAPALMRLIGVGRAVTFAAIGAGSGEDVDVSAEDAYYDHLMLWDKNENCLVGAYRIGFTQEILKSHGPEGMYLNHVFEMESKFYEHLDNAMELSRSFVLPSYQKNPQMLDALWKGIGQAAIAKNCFTLYGSVTISDSFTPLSQSILVDMLDRYYSDDADLRGSVKAPVPFVPQTRNHSLVVDAWSALGLNKLNSVIQDLEGDQRDIPPLIRYYVSLGAKFLSFQVEESFNDAIYCLLKVDLNELPRRYKKRFMGG